MCDLYGCNTVTVLQRRCKRKAVGSIEAGNVREVEPSAPRAQDATDGGTAGIVGAEAKTGSRALGAKK